MSRSFLFVPADSPRKFERALQSSADALILDLEDSVSEAAKPQARDTIRQMLAAPRGDKAVWVRINPLDSGWALDDLRAVVGSRPFGIALPKSRGGADVVRLAHYLDAFESAADVPPGSVRIMPIATELGQAMFGLHSYAGSSPRLWALTWGGEDIAADLGASVNRRNGRYTEPIRSCRSGCLFAAAAAGVRAIDTVSVEIDDAELIALESKEAREDGFTGKIAIHPAQLAPINAAFTPDAAELEFARRIVAVFDANPAVGAFRLDGKMIDRPHLRAALRLLGREQ
ncbi:MAG: CoA ester lyase [Burkholderiales bacterium]|nr:CoA ester lyase [Burkholderiales bacterium]ODU68468.1 MAG: citrate lyase [Lautropia sp. SCN 66-9]